MKIKTWSLMVGMIVTIIWSCKPKTESPKNDIKKPNILLVVADDLGYSDIAPFGGNIHEHLSLPNYQK